MSESRTAIVTGASRGIGLAIAQSLVDKGVRVCVTGRSEGSLTEAVAQLGSDRAIAVAGKAHDPAHQDAVIEEVMRQFGRIDYLVNNVGTNPVAATEVTLTIAPPCSPIHARCTLRVHSNAEKTLISKTFRTASPSVSIAAATLSRRA